ncbi:MAG: hypothetical protein QXX38_01880 [Candidatus Aenigmatarchaeota archaeon]
MKAQISFVEYIVAFSLFISFSSILFLQVLSFMRTYSNEARNEIVRSEAYQISEILINDLGEPIDWNALIGTPNENKIKRIGLSDERFNLTNFLSLDKINALRTKCNQANGYDDVSRWIGATSQFSIILVDRSENPIEPVICKPNIFITRNVNVSIKRQIAFGSKYGEILIQMW